MSGRGKHLELAQQEYAMQIRDRNVSGGAIRYLTEHGIGSYEVAQRYGLGYVASPLPGDEWFENCLAIPYYSRKGEVLDLKYRNLGDHGAKCRKYPGSKNRLYNAQAYFQAGSVIGISEGEPDAIAASVNLNIPTVGVPGVDSWGKMGRVWGPIFKDFLYVMIFADGDGAGKDYAAEVAEDIGWRARVIQCPDDEDVSSMCASGRVEELRAKCQLSE